MLVMSLFHVASMVIWNIGGGTGDLFMPYEYNQLLTLMGEVGILGYTTYAMHRDLSGGFDLSNWKLLLKLGGFIASLADNTFSLAMNFLIHAGL